MARFRLDEDGHGMARRRAASLGRSGELAPDVFYASYESRVSFIPRVRMLSDAAMRSNIAHVGGGSRGRLWRIVTAGSELISV